MKNMSLIFLAVHTNPLYTKIRRFPMRYVSTLCVLFILGCAPFKPTIDHSTPQLLLQHPLPPLPSSFDKPVFDLNIAIFVLEDGSANRVLLRQGSGNPQWDTAAVETVKQWRFAPAYREQSPMRTWYYVHSRVRYATPIYMMLAEVDCMTIDQANSVYEQLTLGKQLADLETPCRIDTVREKYTHMNGVNIYQYPQHIRDVLVKLDINEYSRPVEFGNKYVIFQRLNQDE
jgi:TonB family protein